MSYYPTHSVNPDEQDWAEDRRREQIRAAPTMETIKLCKNCRHFVAMTEVCAKTLRLDYVYGEHRCFSASIERGSMLDTDCGPEGRFWEPINREPE